MKYTQEEQLYFSLAQERSRQGDLKGAIEALRWLVAKRPDSAIFCATFANCLKEAGEIESSTYYFRKAVALSPESEKYSLGLFHILWEAGKEVEALDEAMRYAAVVDSAEYRTIVDEINEKWKGE